jgi:tight adherence protein C
MTMLSEKSWPGPCQHLGRAAAHLLGASLDDAAAHRWGRAALFGGLTTAALGFRGLVMGVVVITLVAVRRRSKEAARARVLLRELNDAVPLLQLAIGAGLTVRSALWSTIPWVRGDLRMHLHAALVAADDGSALADELDKLTEWLGEGCRGFVSVLSAADRYGSPVAEPLALLGSELRLQRRRQLEVAARRIPVRLLFPLALGVLPAFVLLTVVPLVVMSLEGLSFPGG